MDGHSQKYDRQLRLWQAHGQSILQKSHICLLNGSAVGAETLKNLILPGVGSFTVVDQGLVTGEQAGRNFFLDTVSIGKSRSESLVYFLGELNDDVIGKAVVRCPSEIISSSPEFFNQFSLVIATEICEKDMRKLSEICWSRSIALIIIKSHGFFGYCRLVKPEHTIIERHDAPGSDFRFDCPFPALVSHVNDINIDTMDSMGASHVPYVALILKALLNWKSKNDGALPSNSLEKAAFRHEITLLKHPSAMDDENIVEALSMAYKAYSETKIPSEVVAILGDPKTTNLSATSSDFWLLVAALKRFTELEGNGLLPVSGVVPDMKADTDSFIKLQRIYRTKAHEDRVCIRRHLDTLLNSVGRDLSSINDDQVEIFSKNASTLRLIRFRSIESEYANSLAGTYVDDENIAYYWLLRAVDRFRDVYERYPGSCIQDIDTDTQSLGVLVSQLHQENNVSGVTINLDQTSEIVRAGGCELHNIASIIGGIASQEAIKLLTGQYTPVDNTVIFNGIRSAFSVFKL
ncbi:hypothetical protein BASA50_001474 [Batrachochytrium salamandrivorans]|uniref:NEDD8-activating enzyme E1 regulatory subunit n=1 Tax=Batrachochytrium salamandrivorans TaxID=1357716 RepID=A0ABQ8FP17_9FUNG|nr:hypothetical protein BASA62_007848 [Batrachochytrium salamandrivorans]KAH6583530.1 hypothetical protein BASA60_001414 [Batrachochytrium salamandrivorans]KAH6596706.1 hypothetical protein BASA61_003400 [Batrachochytrium salamandrivorans]KAH6601616.1 hypothetical protein BASA50_001474 [Batrachochytrium salamandrivorans]KAH9269651.1 hypothetical protein BASA83_008310 [Batrachochytrium salamandrivorans]